MSMHYRLCLITVRMKELQNRRIVRFQKGQTFGACLAGASLSKTPTLLGVSRAAVPKVIAAYINHWKT